MMNTVLSDIVFMFDRTDTTIMFRGILKMLYTVARVSSATYFDLIIPMLGK